MVECAFLGGGGGGDAGLGVGLGGCDAIGITFRERGRDIDGLAKDEGGVLVADALFEHQAALVWGDHVQQGGHHVHRGDDHLAAVGQDEGDLVALEGVQLLARDHQRRPFFRVAISYNRRSTAVQR